MKQHRSLTLESLESRRLMTALTFDDSALAPAGYACPLNTALPVENVKNFGAAGNGLGDDTAAVDKALAAAQAAGGGIVYLPAGTYNVTPALAGLGNAIFTISSSNIVFIGDHNAAGQSTTHLDGFMPGLTSPANVAGQRFAMFAIVNQAGQTLSGDQIRSLNVNGEAPWTGNYAVANGGPGWDMTHKGLCVVATTNGGDITGTLVFNSTFQNWRGEEIWDGGDSRGTVQVIQDTLAGSNADAISISASVTAAYCTIGTAAAPVYQGVENFASVAGEQTTIDHCTFTDNGLNDPSYGQSIALLGIPGTSATVSNNTIQGSVFGVLLSEVDANVTISANTFGGGVQQGVIESILGIYPSFPTGFNGVKIANNNADVQNLLCTQGIQITNLTLTGNNVYDGGNVADSSLSGWPGLVDAGNTVHAGPMPVTPPPVYTPVLTTLVLTPASASLGLGQTAQFAAVGYDQQGLALATQPKLTWSSSIGSITSGGLLTAPAAAGSGTVTATSGTVHGTAAVTVAAAPTPPPAPVSSTPRLNAVATTIATPILSGTALASQGRVTVWIDPASNQNDNLETLTATPTAAGGFSVTASTLAPGSYVAEAGQYFGGKWIASKVVSFTVAKAASVSAAAVTAALPTNLKTSPAASAAAYDLVLMNMM